MTSPAPNPAVATLAPLVGRWRVEGALPIDPPMTMAGETEFAWLGEQAFVVQRWQTERPEFPNGIAILAPDETGERFVQHYFDSRGVERRYEMSLNDGVWRLWRDDPHFAQRFTGTLSPDGATIAGRLEKAFDGGPFEHDFDLTYTRIAPDLLALARASYGAYETGDRSVLDDLLADDFVFYSPPDPGIDRAAYFERCWPNHERHKSFAYERLQEIGNGEVLITYVAERTDGSRFRNTEVLRFVGDKLTRAEVYFGWDL
jgi:ketosteroid isomerase-like protein